MTNKAEQIIESTRKLSIEELVELIKETIPNPTISWTYRKLGDLAVSDLRVTNGQEEEKETQA